MKKTVKKYTFSSFLILITVILLLSGCVISAFADTLGESTDTVTPHENDGVMVGIDVSSHQGDIDWVKVRASGVQFAMLRICSYSLSTHSYSEDTKFAANIEGAGKQGIHLGAYFFSYAKDINEIEQEAQMVVDILDKYPATFSFPIVLDAEEWAPAAEAGNTIRPFAADACVTFTQILEENGYYAMVYANKSWFNDVILPSSKVSELSLWQATYPAKNYAQKYAGFLPRQGYSIAQLRPEINNNDSNVKMWQYTDSGVVSGISGSVDMDVAYYNFSTLIPSGGFNGYTEGTHIHDYWTSYNGTNHFDKCACGDIRKDSESVHKIEVLFDEARHYYGCACGYKSGDNGTTHVLSLKTKTNEHYYSCDCGYIDISTRTGHSYKQKNNDEEHYKQCECGYIDPSTREEHAYDKYSYDLSGHWQECTCGYKTDALKHTLDKGTCKICDAHVHEYGGTEYNETSHWKICVWCEEKLENAHSLNNCECAECGYTAHIYEMKSDCQYHWAACKSCGNSTPRMEHNISGSSCTECGGSGHLYEIKYDEEAHWLECATCTNKIETEEHNLENDICVECGYEYHLPETAVLSSKTKGCGALIGGGAMLYVLMLCIPLLVRKRE